MPTWKEVKEFRANISPRPSAIATLIEATGQRGEYHNCQYYSNSQKMNNIKVIQRISDSKSIGKRNNGKYLLFDHTLSVEHSYTRDFDFMKIREDGRIDVQLNDSWGMMDVQGRILVFPRFSSPLIFENGLCVVQDSLFDLGHFGVVDYNGVEIVPAIYYDIMLEENEVLNIFGPNEISINFIFGCVDDTFVPSIGCNGGYISHLRETFGVDMYLRNGLVFSGKYECFYVTFDRQFVFAGYKGEKIIGYDGNREEYMKRYLGRHDLIDKNGNVILKGITDFIYYPPLIAVRLGWSDTKWAFLNPDNGFLTKEGNIVTLDAFLSEKEQNVYWSMSTDAEIKSNFAILSKLSYQQNLEYMINEMREKTVMMDDDYYENETYPTDNHDPHQYTKKLEEDSYGILDALDGEPSAFYNIE